MSTAPADAARRVLIVEDDPRIAELIARAFSDGGLVTTRVGDGASALAAIRRHRPDLLLLDIGLPSTDGLEICRRLKRDPEFADLPIVIMSARDSDLDRIVGLELGADDYVCKPFNFRELLLRVKAVLRRTGGPALTVHAFGPMEIDVPRRIVKVRGEACDLTAREFDVLAALVQARGRPLSRAALLRDVWGHDHATPEQSRTVDVHVRRLRQKLGPGAELIETLKNVGYRLNTVADEAISGER